MNKHICTRVAVVDSFGVETAIFSQATNTVRNVNNKSADTIFVRRVGRLIVILLTPDCHRNVTKGPSSGAFLLSAVCFLTRDALFALQ